MAVDGHGCAMTIADYIAFGALIVLALWAWHGCICEAVMVGARRCARGELLHLIARCRL